MKLFNRKDRRTPMEKEIERLYNSMEVIEDKTSDEYKNLADTLERLTAIQAKSKNSKSVREKLSPNTVAVVLGSIAEIVLIIKYEEINVISTKAFGRILRGRA